MIEIINGDHDPESPFMIVDRLGMHVDFSGVDGQLWDCERDRLASHESRRMGALSP